MTVGENIKKARKNAGLTQKELADALNITQSAIAKFESNATNIKMSTIRKFSEVLNVAMSELIGDNWGSFSTNEIRSDLTKQGLNLQLFAEPDPDKEILDRNYNNVNAAGKKKIVEYSNDIAVNPKYTDEIK